MKRKALIVALLLAMGMLTMPVGNAGAALAVYTVTLSSVTANYWGYYTFVATDTNGAFPATSFFIVDNGSGLVKAEYAAALTAWSNGGKAVIYGDFVTTACLSVSASN